MSAASSTRTAWSTRRDVSICGASDIIFSQQVNGWELVMHFSLVDDDLTVGAGLSQEQLLS